MGIHTFRGHKIEIPNPYSAGHQLTDEEAEALGRYRAELIMNRLRSAFDKTADKDLTTGDPVMREARAIAVDLLKSPKAAELVAQIKDLGLEPTKKTEALTGIQKVNEDLYNRIIQTAEARVNSLEELA